MAHVAFLAQKLDLLNALNLQLQGKRESSGGYGRETGGFS